MLTVLSSVLSKNGIASTTESKRLFHSSVCDCVCVRVFMKTVTIFVHTLYNV